MGGAGYSHDEKVAEAQARGESLPAVQAAEAVQGAGATGPTIEEFVQRGYPAATYPPTGYAEVASPGLDAFRAYQADPGNEDLLLAALVALDLDGEWELTHGKGRDAVTTPAPGDGRQPEILDTPHTPTEDEAADLGRPGDDR